MGMVTVVTALQLTPSADSKPVIAFPLRTMRTQSGGVESEAAALSELPPVEGRHCSATPLADETSMSACAEPGSSVSRIITPAFDHALAAVTLATRAVIEPSPASGWYTKWN